MRYLIVIFLVAIMASSALAQKPVSRRDRDRETNSEPRFNNPDPRRDENRAQVARTLPYLAYTLGELHYLSFACEGLDAQQWRERMVGLLAMEAPEQGPLRDRLIENFNDGYQVQQRFRPMCGPEVEAERRALAHRGQDLAEMMRASYFD